MSDTKKNNDNSGDGVLTHDQRRQLDALRTLAGDLLNPEELGYAVTAEVRDRARIALGRQPVECAHLGADKGRPA